MSAKVILDTDIGTDVDDAWALSLCLSSPEIELVGVTLVHADLDTRAKIALKLLKLARRLDVPVYKGLSAPIADGASIYWGGHEGKGADFSDIQGLQARPGAVDFILDTVRANPDEIVVCSVGPMTNIGDAIRRDTAAMRHVRKLVIMATSFTGEGGECASREHNACADPVATKLVLESGIPAIVVGLNVTLQVTIRREDVKPLECRAFGNYLASMTYQYFDIVKRDVLYMHDPLAVATIIVPSVVATRRMAARVFDDGRIAWSSGGPLDVSISVDARLFRELLLSRIYAFNEQGESSCK